MCSRYKASTRDSQTSRQILHLHLVCDGLAIRNEAQPKPEHQRLCAMLAVSHMQLLRDGSSACCKSAGRSWVQFELHKLRDCSLHKSKLKSLALDFFLQDWGKQHTMTPLFHDEFHIIFASRIIMPVQRSVNSIRAFSSAPSHRAYAEKASSKPMRLQSVVTCKENLDIGELEVVE